MKTKRTLKNFVVTKTSIERFKLVSTREIIATDEKEAAKIIATESPRNDGGCVRTLIDVEETTVIEQAK